MDVVVVLADGVEVGRVRLPPPGPSRASYVVEVRLDGPELAKRVLAQALTSARRVGP